jgi:hypothetical protein
MTVHLNVVVDWPEWDEITHRMFLYSKQRSARALTLTVKVAGIFPQG